MKQRIKRPFYEGEPPYLWLWMGWMPTSKRKMSRKRWKQLKIFDKLTNESIGVWERRAFSVHIQQKEALSFERTSSKVVPDGLEPPLTEPKTVVLPLHHGTINGCKGTPFRACHQILSQLFYAFRIKKSTPLLHQPRHPAPPTPSNHLITFIIRHLSKKNIRTS